MIRAGLLAVVAALLLSPVARAEPPPVHRLFGCPLRAPTEAFRPPAEWRVYREGELGLSFAAPAGWEVLRSGAVVSVGAPDGRTTLTLRRGRLVSAERLSFVRRSMELTELGPSHAGAACQGALTEAVAAVAGWSAVQVGVYGRPLAGRQRSYAVFAPLVDGTLTVVVTVTWRSRDRGPDLDTVRRLLGGVTAH